MKKLSEMEVENVKVILKIDGVETEAIPATPDELKEAQIDIPCDCGLQVCGSDNYVYVCRTYGNGCAWFRTRVRCNEN